MTMTQNETGPQVAAQSSFNSGEGGIRTLGGVNATSVFETDPIGRSGTSPSLTPSSLVDSVYGRKGKRPAGGHFGKGGGPCSI